MTDTPRTKDELLAIFADAQGPAQITPQDMRDFVVSIADPVEGGGMPSVGVPGDDEYELFTGASGSPQSIPSDTVTFVHFLTLFEGPSEWVDTSTYTSDYYGVTVPTDSSFELPEGLYYIGFTVQMSDPGAGKVIQAAVDFTDDPSGVDPLFYGTVNLNGITAPNWQPGGYSTSVVMYANGLYRVTSAMATAGIRVGAWVLQDSGSPKNLVAASLAIAKLGGIA